MQRAIYRRVIPVLLLVGAMFYVSCGGGGGEGSHPPAISGLAYSPDWVTQDDGGGTVEVTFSVNFSDPGGDIAQIRLITYDSGGLLVGDIVLDIPGAGGITYGYVYGSLQVGSTVVDDFSFEACIYDARGDSSNHLTGVFSVFARIGLQAAGVAPYNIVLNWTDPYGGAKDFIVERSTSPDGGFSEVVTVESTAPNFVDSALNGLSPGSTYYYRVKASDASPEGYSNPVDAATLASGYDTPTVLDAAFGIEKIAGFGGPIYGVEIGPGGNLFVSSGRTIYEVDGATYAVTTYATDVGNSGETVWDLAVDGAGRLFAVSCFDSATCDILEIHADGSSSYLYTGTLCGASITAASASILFSGHTTGSIYQVSYQGVASTYLAGFDGPSPGTPNVYGVSVLPSGDLTFGHRYEGRVYLSTAVGVHSIANLPQYLIFQVADGSPGVRLVSATSESTSVFRMDNGFLSVLAAGLDGAFAIDSLSVNGASGIAADADGTVFVGSGRDLWKISPL
ncbi:MAG: hypothetical protein JSV26_04880 [bacterium]|nr:MAG: hypothetical protein JSV26_04880 [bacterium]